MAILMVNPECLSPDQVKDQCLATAEADGQTAEAPNGSAAPVEVWWRGGQTCGEWMSWLQDELAEQKSRKNLRLNHWNQRWQYDSAWGDRENIFRHIFSIASVLNLLGS